MDEDSGVTDLTLDSLTHTVPSTASPMDSGLTDFLDSTVKNLVVVIPEEEELPEFNSIEELTQWLGVDDA
jgi:hypothetical protein